MSVSSSENLIEPESDSIYSSKSCCSKKCFGYCCKANIYHARVVNFGRLSKTQEFPVNKINNQKYNILTFIPIVLFQQFSVFLNLVFLIIACSQFIAAIRVGYLYTYWGPLGFVLFVTLIREAVDDIRRWQRDREVNSCRYGKYVRNREVSVSSAEIKVRVLD